MCPVESLPQQFVFGYDKLCICQWNITFGVVLLWGNGPDSKSVLLCYAPFPIFSIAEFQLQIEYSG